MDYTHCISSFKPVLRKQITGYLNNMVYDHVMSLPYVPRDISMKYVMEWTNLILNTNPLREVTIHEKGSMYVANKHKIMKIIYINVGADCDSVNLITATETINLYNFDINNGDDEKRNRFYSFDYIRRLLESTSLLLIIKMRGRDYVTIMKEDEDRYVVIDTSIDLCNYQRPHGWHPLRADFDSNSVDSSYSSDSE
jgi:hypothetical protein